MTDVSRYERRIRAALRKVDRDQDGVEAAVTRYARALCVADRAFSEIPEGSLLTVGSAGQQAAHPAVRVWLDAEKAAAVFGVALGLEPEKQAGKPGRPAGAVSAKDRRGEPAKFARLRAVPKAAG